MIVEISADVMPYDVVISCEKPGVIAATPNVPITVVVDVKKDGIDGKSAYELVVANGYPGTMEQFAQDLLRENIDGGIIY